MTIGELLIRHFAKPPALKKISNPFSKPFAITETEKPYMIASILLMNQKQSIVNLKTRTQTQTQTRTQTQSPNPESEPKT